MAVAALVLFALWALLAFGLRAFIQWRRTGDTGLRMSGGPAGSLEWWARVLFVGALGTGLAAPIVDLGDSIDPIDALDGSIVQALGIVLAVAGVAGTLAVQLAMGDSWRVGVDLEERTALVTAGPFAVVRNPIFSVMIVTAIGLALMVPNAIAMIGLAVLVLSIELQVRKVEEPYLLATHGPAYADYTARVGRFVPGLGRRRLR